MDRASVVVLTTLVVYKVVLLAIGFLAERWTRDEADFLLGGRKLGPLVAAISASASSSSVWTLLGVSGYAYKTGLQGLWLFPACVGGFAINWWLVAPRLRRAAAATGALTVTELLAGPHRGPSFKTARVVASLILVFSLTVYVASQFGGAGKSFTTQFENLSTTTAILIGASIVVVYTIVGGFWAVSLTDTLQGLMMALTALVAPIAALIAVGGPTGLLAGLAQVDVPGFDDPFAGHGGALALWSILALLGIGLGYPGQPHVVNRFMAVASDRDIARARAYAMTWAVVVYAGMITLGLAGRVLTTIEAVDNETIFFTLTEQLFPTVVFGMMLAAVLSAIMSTADSQLLVASSAVSHDLGWSGRDEKQKLLRSRAVVFLTSAVAVGLALLFADETIFSSVLFAWTALGAAFGPLLIVTLWRGPIGPGRSLAAMLAGFVLAVAAFSTPAIGELAVKGTAWERVVPFVAAFAILLWPPARRR